MILIDTRKSGNAEKPRRFPLHVHETLRVGETLTVSLRRYYDTSLSMKEDNYDVWTYAWCAPVCIPVWFKSAPVDRAYRSTHLVVDTLG